MSVDYNENDNDEFTHDPESLDDGIRAIVLASYTSLHVDAALQAWRPGDSIYFSSSDIFNSISINDTISTDSGIYTRYNGIYLGKLPHSTDPTKPQQVSTSKKYRSHNYPLLVGSPSILTETAIFRGLTFVGSVHISGGTPLFIDCTFLPTLPATKNFGHPASPDMLSKYRDSAQPAEYPLVIRTGSAPIFRGCTLIAGRSGCVYAEPGSAALFNYCVFDAFDLSSPTAPCPIRMPLLAPTTLSHFPSRAPGSIAKSHPLTADSHTDPYNDPEGSDDDTGYREGRGNPRSPQSESGADDTDTASNIFLDPSSHDAQIGPQTDSESNPSDSDPQSLIRNKKDKQGPRGGHTQRGSGADTHSDSETGGEGGPAKAWEAHPVHRLAARLYSDWNWERFPKYSSRPPTLPRSHTERRKHTATGEPAIPDYNPSSTPVGLYLDHTGPLLLSASIIRGVGTGILCAGGSEQASVSRCIIRDCSTVGIRTMEDSTPTFQETIVTRCGLYAVLSSGTGGPDGPIFRNCTVNGTWKIHKVWPSLIGNVCKGNYITDKPHIAIRGVEIRKKHE